MFLLGFGYVGEYGQFDSLLAAELMAGPLLQKCDESKVGQEAEERGQLQGW
jgi:hypothetical protein